MPTPIVVPRAKAYLKVRQKSVRDAMKELNLDAIMLTHPPDLAYLTNFTGDDSIGIITAKDFYIVTDFRYKEQVGIEAGWVKVTIRDGKMGDALAKTFADAKVRRVGFEANFTTVGQIDALQSAIKDQQKTQFLSSCNLRHNNLFCLRKVEDHDRQSIDTNYWTQLDAKSQ